MSVSWKSELSTTSNDPSSIASERSRYLRQQAVLLTHQQPAETELHSGVADVEPVFYVHTSLEGQ